MNLHRGVTVIDVGFDFDGASQSVHFGRQGPGNSIRGQIKTRRFNLLVGRVANSSAISRPFPFFSLVVVAVAVAAAGGSLYLA